MVLTEEREPAQVDGSWQPIGLNVAATLSPAAVLHELGSTPRGLTSEEASRRLAMVGPNALRSHGARVAEVFVRQLHNPLLILLVVTAAASAVVGEGTDAAIIMTIICLSVGLGFFNEYRSARAVEELHSRIRSTALAFRDANATPVDVTQVVPGDVVQLSVGDVVPADVRLLRADGLECDESVLTGESMAAEKQVDPIQSPDSALALADCAFMGTVVRDGSGIGVVTRTGTRTEFGAIAMRLGERQPQTAFQLGLRGFSIMLVRVTAVLAGSILALNIALGHGALESLLFALAIAVGLTPQLLPAIVTVSLSTGARRLAERKVVVKRLVAIEDLGNVDVLFTDKTGTLTAGQITFAGGLDATGRPSDELLRAGLWCNEAMLENGKVVGGNQLDRVLWDSPHAAEFSPDPAARLAVLPFDYDRRLASVLVREDTDDCSIIVKGAPEAVLARCTTVAPEAHAVLGLLFAQGSRVVAVATRPAHRSAGLTPEDERDLQLTGFLTFLDPPKPDAADAITALGRLGVEVKVITGDNDVVAVKVADDIGLEVRGTITGSELDNLDDDQLAARLPATTIFARVTPEQKSRLIKAERQLGATVGFLGDGVNDAVALHDADAGVS